MKRKLIVTIVPRGQGERIAQAAITGGAGGGTILLGKGTAPSATLQFLGLGETAKDITISLVDGSRAGTAISEIQKAASGYRHFGVLFSVEVGAFVKSGSVINQEKFEDFDMDNGKEGRKVISVVVSRGYAEDAMAAARKAGASGGTILLARGTARPDDAEFFGIRLVPEKEMLLIVVEDSKYDAVFSAVHSLPCFSEKGSGIEFSMPIADFVQLGVE